MTTQTFAAYQEQQSSAQHFGDVSAKSGACVPGEKAIQVQVNSNSIQNSAYIQHSAYSNWQQIQ